MILINCHTKNSGLKIELIERTILVTVWDDDKTGLSTCSLSLEDAIKFSNIHKEGFDSCKNKIIVGSVDYFKSNNSIKEEILDKGAVPCIYFEMNFGTQPKRGWQEHLKCLNCEKKPE